MAQLAVAGALLHYEVWGKNEVAGSRWVTLINGHNRPLNDFRLLGKHLVALGFQVLALDNRGSGLTTNAGAFTLADMAADVSALWQAEGIAKTQVVGVSMGGFIAQTLAAGAQTRAKVERLVLISTAMRQAMIRRDASAWTSDPDAVERKLSPYFTSSFAEKNRALVKGMAKQIAKAVEAGSFVAASQAQIAAVSGLDLTLQTRTIRAATTVLHGEDDQIIPLAAGQELAGEIPGAKLEVFAAAGHLLLAEAPKALYAAVAKALAGG